MNAWHSTFRKWRRALLLLALSCESASVLAGNCLVQGGKMIGDCEGVTIGQARSLQVKSSGSFGGTYGDVTVMKGAVANITGVADKVVVRSGARLILTGTSGDVRVDGQAEIDGIAADVYVSDGAQVVIRGVVDSVRGKGSVVKKRGAIIAGIYITARDTSGP